MMILCNKILNTTMIVLWRKPTMCAFGICTMDKCLVDFMAMQLSFFMFKV